MQCLLSSSADKTVRLWRVGFDECQKIFSHNDFGNSLILCKFIDFCTCFLLLIQHELISINPALFEPVTCIQFNPVDDNYFISGSVDGKFRIWSISSCKVVDWTDIKEIVTALCYQPDGKVSIYWQYFV